MTLALSWLLILKLGATTVVVAEFSGPNAFGDCIANGKVIVETAPLRGFAPTCVPLERTR